MTYAAAADINDIIKSLRKSSKALFTWFKNDLLKSNADKSHVLVHFSEYESVRMSIM